MIVVSDTTPLLTLFKIGRIDVLNKLYNSVHIPFAVFEELTRNTEYPEEAEYFRNCPFLEVHSDLSAERVSLLQRATGLDLGESEAIILADEKQPSLLLIDESHVTFPQLRGMYNGDRSRKTVLVDYGFRLPSALDNRPLNYSEFESLMPRTVVCTSATPGDYELEKCGHEVAEQIIRPTGLLDPKIEVKPTIGQIDDLLQQIEERIEKNERVMVVTLTIKMAEDLTSYLKERGIKVTYLHNETKTLEREQIIYQLRKGKFDVLVGINLLREGLDIPEVSLIAILDADKEGFLRSTRSLIQVIGRAARNANGKVIMYADGYSDSMKEAIAETERRRSIQSAYNEENGIIPTTIVKGIRPPLHNTETEVDEIVKASRGGKMSRSQIEKQIKYLESQMKKAAKEYDFERAAEIRDIMFELKASLNS